MGAATRGAVAAHAREALTHRRERPLLVQAEPPLHSVPRPNHSELWQRLGAARELANKTHQDVGQVFGLDGATVALWESPDPATRLQPTAQQVMRIAKLCRLPLYLLVDDAVSVKDIQSYTAP